VSSELSSAASSVAVAESSVCDDESSEAGAGEPQPAKSSRDAAMAMAAVVRA
jgi:hypothetical protein